MQAFGFNESIDYIGDYAKTLDLIQSNPLSNYFPILATSATPKLFMHIDNVVAKMSPKDNYQEIQRLIRSICLKEDSGLISLSVRDDQHTMVMIDKGELPTTIQSLLSTDTTSMSKVSFYDMIVLRLFRIIRATLDNYIWNGFMSNLFFDILSYIKETTDIHIERFFSLFEHYFIYDLELLSKNRGIHSISTMINDFYIRLVDRYFHNSYQYIVRLKNSNNTLRYMKSIKKLSDVIASFYIVFLPIFSMCTISYQSVLDSFNNSLQLFLYEEDDIFHRLYTEGFISSLHYSDKNADFLKPETVKSFCRCLELVRLYCIKFKYPELQSIIDNQEVVQRIVYKLLQNADVPVNEIYIDTLSRILDMGTYIEHIRQKIAKDKSKRHNKVIGSTVSKYNPLSRTWNSYFDHKYESITGFWLLYYISYFVDTLLRLKPFNPAEEEKQQMYYNGKLDVYMNPMLRGRYIPRCNLRFLASKRSITLSLVAIFLAIWYGVLRLLS